MSPRLRVLTVLGLGFFGLAFIAARVGRLVLRKLRGLPFQPTRMDTLAAAGAVVAAVLLIYGAFVEPRWLAVETVELPILAPGTGPVTIVQISDLHSTGRPVLEPEVPARVAELEPDLIVFTGDAVNHSDGLPIVHELLAQLAQLAPVYAVRGNRELGQAAGIDVVGSTGARELEGEAVDLEIRGARLRLVGSGTPEGWSRVRRLLMTTPGDALPIYLGHTPDAVVDVAHWGAELVLAGHTHGGQVALPFYGALFTASRFDKRFESGLYRVDGTWLYVNRGLGLQANLPPIRFLARPEISHIVLQPAPDDPAGRLTP
ncbi:MAG: metallophosphoesterase [Acidobacteriota bacterium]